jgi:hypothetical protein
VCSSDLPKDIHIPINKNVDIITNPRAVGDTYSDLWSQFSSAISEKLYEWMHPQRQKQ